MSRTGEWAYSLPFSLGNYYGVPKMSVPFSLETINVVPVLAEFAVSGADPTGSRHLISHASFSRILASGNGDASTLFDDFDLNAMDISIGSGISNTKCMIFRIANFDCPSNSRVYNMKLWVSNTDDFLTDDWKVIYTPSGIWEQDYSIPVRFFADRNKWLPISLPSAPNLFRADGKFTIYGTEDTDVSQFLYLAVAASGTLPLGEYGSASGFFIRTTYDMDNIDVLRD